MGERTVSAIDPFVLPHDNGQVARSLDFCRVVTRRRARNFYYGLKLMPEPKRSALYAVYAFMRACDDLVDDGCPDLHAGVDRLEQFRDQMRQALDASTTGQLPPGEVWPALRYVCATYPVDHAHLHAMLEGQKYDLQKNRYHSFDQLRDYCYKVAGVVGLVCISIWGHDDNEAAGRMAVERGLALQLTNILRDLVEDAHRNRVYLPDEELHRFGLDAQAFVHMILQRVPDDRFDRLMAFQVERVDRYYRAALPLENRICPDCRSASWAIMQLYRRLLEKIAANPRRVLAQRVRLSRWEKLLLVLAASRRRWD